MPISNILYTMFSLFSSVAIASGTPEHSRIEVSQIPAPDGLALTFKVTPHAGMAATMDAPWKLEVEDKDLVFSKNPLVRTDVDAALPGFVLRATTKPSHPKGQLKYTLTSFICTKEKTQCYREVHKGTFDWTQTKH